MKFSYFLFVLVSVSESHSAMVSIARDRCKMSVHVPLGSNYKCLANRGSALINKLRELENKSWPYGTCEQMYVTEHT